MITVLYFARLREALGVSQEVVEAVDGETVQQLMERLAAGKGDAGVLLLAEDTQAAINQQLAELNASVVEGDEVAFFPPVTGG